MTEKRIQDVLALNDRFIRSVNLERDFGDPHALDGYVLTAHSRDCLSRIEQGLQDRSSQRAWRITGDYGSGKSSFALFLAHWFSGRNRFLPTGLQPATHASESESVPARFIPVLITGAREPLGIAILRGLLGTAKSLRKSKGKAQIISALHDGLKSKDEISGGKLCEMIAKLTARIIEDGDGTGLVVILDELGKFLEFAALHPERQDVYVLQQLAELSARSAKRPIFLLGLLHQGFGDYADQLSHTSRREWEKVAARFDEIIFNQPLEQVTSLMSVALNVRRGVLPKSVEHDLRGCMQKTATMGWYGAASRSTLLHDAARLYPLHPSVLPVLVRVFRRFGQNERSLFSFLLSHEPFGLQDFAHKHKVKESSLYRLHNLFDYIKYNFGHRLGIESYRSHWNQIDSMIQSFTGQNEAEIHVLKTVGILNLLNSSDLLATDESIALSIAGLDRPYEKTIRSAIKSLQQEKRVLYNRGVAAGLCLWPHTSVDLEQAYENACKAVGGISRVADLVIDLLQPRPIVARRHYIETGNLRYFDVRLISASGMTTQLLNDLAGADGYVLIVLCENQEERETANNHAMSEALASRPDVLFGITQPLSDLHGLVQEARRWEWVARNTPDLNADRYAAEEVARQVASADLLLTKRVQDFVGLSRLNESIGLRFYRQGRVWEVESGRQFLSRLSDICDKVYLQAPHIKNELVNRSSLSSAAAAARMRLIERLFRNGHEELLGMDPQKRPPEMSVYLSLLKSTGMHRLVGSSWEIVEPSHSKDPANLLPLLKKIRNILALNTDGRVNVSGIFGQLRKAPFGVREGVMPLLLAVFCLSHEHEIAVYENGTFVKSLGGEEFRRLTKAPASFELQLCAIAGLRRPLFDKLRAMLELKTMDNRRAELLEVVRSLCTSVARLPIYVHRTHKLSKNGIAVRDAILSARDPSKLLFSDLPLACGCEVINPKAQTNSGRAYEFVELLRDSLEELKLAYPALQDRLKSLLQSKLGCPTSSFSSARVNMANRAERIAIYVREASLKAFCLRLMDQNLPESEWVESIGSLLVPSPPSKWRDIDEAMFEQEVERIAAHFRRMESVFFEKSAGNLVGSIGVRFAITKSDGSERESVMHFTPDEQSAVLVLREEFVKILQRDKRLGLVAASEAVWKIIDQKETH